MKNLKPILAKAALILAASFPTPAAAQTLNPESFSESILEKVNKAFDITEEPPHPESLEARERTADFDGKIKERILALISNGEELVGRFTISNEDGYECSVKFYPIIIQLPPDQTTKKAMEFEVRCEVEPGAYATTKQAFYVD